MERIEAAILRTILYADVFHFPLTLQEIHRFLIYDEAIPLSQIANYLKNSPFLLQFLDFEDGYYCLKSEKEKIKVRCQREAQSSLLWESAYRYGHYFGMIPFVRMVALTGALAVRNPASEQDDFDYILVTECGRVWTARLFAVMIVRLVRLMGRELCPNYVLANDQLLQKRQDSFVAHEIAQMRPIYGTELYQALLAENIWTKAYLANIIAYETEANPKTYWLKELIEKILSGRLGDWLEAWEYRRKQEKFAPQIQKTGSAAQIDSGQAKGHFKDNGHPILEQYHHRLRVYGLLDESLAMAGD